MRHLRSTGLFYFFFLGIILLQSCGIRSGLNDRPDLTGFKDDIPDRVQINDSVYQAGDHFLRKNQFGIWELYVSGDPLELGLLTGSLTRELARHQEDIFFKRIGTLVPSERKQFFLRKFLSWYNRKLHLHIRNDYKAEIYGVTRFASDSYNEIAQPYLRALYLHGAHDIGHALQDLALVGCSSFAVWDEQSADGDLLLARNFDFYAGDDFAENKLISFVSPDRGYNFMSVSWAGFIGVVSGMNDQGLTITINAGKSRIPFVAKTPISLVAREILQYAATIEEAVEIAKNREVFVSEALLIGSAHDGKAAIIEVSPGTLGVYDVPNLDQLICSNHFQSDVYRDDKRNNEHIVESHSQYRFDRMAELLAGNKKISPSEAVTILRDRDGLNDKPLGYGNEKALNQMLAHHGVVFQPHSLRAYVSANPYQMGAFVAYDLDSIFNPVNQRNVTEPLNSTKYTIEEDPFIYTAAFKDYQAYRRLEQKVEDALRQDNAIEPDTLYRFMRLNPDYWKAYALAGEYYYKKGYYAAAYSVFKKAAMLEITTLPEREWVERRIRSLKRKIGI